MCSRVPSCSLNRLQSHFNWTEWIPPAPGGGFDDGSHKCMLSEFRQNKIDLGAVAFRTDFLREQHARFDDAKTYDWDSDGQFISRLASRTKHALVLQQVLFLHQ